VRGSQSILYVFILKEWQIKGGNNTLKINKKIKFNEANMTIPYHKLFRYLWNIVIVTVSFCILSYSVMEYYHPEFDNSLPAYSVIMMFFLVGLVSGVAEILYEAVDDMFRLKWLKNPWLFFFVPALIIGGFQSLSLYKNPDQYLDGLWIDLFVFPIGAFVYLISREFFTLIFMKRKHPRQSV
jgi:undecaprenyl pyrophosphate phosphatase UppP